MLETCNGPQVYGGDDSGSNCGGYAPAIKPNNGLPPPLDLRRGPSLAFASLANLHKGSHKLRSRSLEEGNRMSLDPDNQKILDMMKAAGHPPVNELQPDEARKMYRASPGGLAARAPRCC